MRQNRLLDCVVAGVVASVVIACSGPAIDMMDAAVEGMRDAGAQVLEDAAQAMRDAGADGAREGGVMRDAAEMMRDAADAMVGDARAQAGPRVMEADCDVVSETTQTQDEFVSVTQQYYAEFPADTNQLPSITAWSCNYEQFPKYSCTNEQGCIHFGPEPSNRRCGTSYAFVYESSFLVSCGARSLRNGEVVSSNVASKAVLVIH